MSEIKTEETPFSFIAIKAEIDEELIDADSNVDSCKDICSQTGNTIKKEETENGDCNKTVLPTSSESKMTNEPNAKDSEVTNSKKDQKVLNTMFHVDHRKCKKATSSTEDCKCPFHTEEAITLETYSCEGTQQKKSETSTIDEDIPDQPSNIYRCPFCVYRTPLKELMTKHYKQSHNITSKDKSYKCQYCTFVTNRLWVLKRHLTNHKKPMKSYKCDLCVYETNRRAALATHKRIHEIASMRTEYKSAMCLF